MRDRVQENNRRVICSRARGMLAVLAGTLLGLAAVFCAGVPAPEAQAQSAQSTQSTGPTLAPAEYKPLPVGTRVNYGTWRFKVEKSAGADVTVKTPDDRSIHLYGVFGRSGHGMYTAGDEAETGWASGQASFYSTLNSGAKSAVTRTSASRKTTGE